jgi:hypothetical protein
METAALLIGASFSDTVVVAVKTHRSARFPARDVSTSIETVRDLLLLRLLLSEGVSSADESFPKVSARR